MTKLYSILFLALIGATTTGSVFAARVKLPYPHPAIAHVEDKLYEDHHNKDGIKLSGVNSYNMVGYVEDKLYEDHHKEDGIVLSGEDSHLDGKSAPTIVEPENQPQPFVA